MCILGYRNFFVVPAEISVVLVLHISDPGSIASNPCVSSSPIESDPWEQSQEWALKATRHGTTPKNYFNKILTKWLKCNPVCQTENEIYELILCSPSYSSHINTSMMLFCVWNYVEKSYPNLYGCETQGLSDNCSILHAGTSLSSKSSRNLRFVS